jgi:DNA-binding NarL/FixJ family response regulator
MNWNKQRILTAVIILVAMCSIGFSFSAGKTNWFWARAPYVAILLMAIAFVASRAWLQIEQKKQNEKIQSILSRLKAEQNQREDPSNGLSGREKEVLLGIAAGKSNKQIAEELFIEVSTVKTHINKIYKTLNVASRKEASELIRK